MTCTATTLTVQISCYVPRYSIHSLAEQMMCIVLGRLLRERRWRDSHRVRSALRAVTINPSSQFEPEANQIIRIRMNMDSILFGSIFLWFCFQIDSALKWPRRLTESSDEKEEEEEEEERGRGGKEKKKKPVLSSSKHYLWNFVKLLTAFMRRAI